MTMMLLVLTSALTVALWVRIAPADRVWPVSSAPATVERAPYLMSEVLPVAIESRSLRLRGGLPSAAAADVSGLASGRSERGCAGAAVRSIVPVARERFAPAGTSLP